MSLYLPDVAWSTLASNVTLGQSTYTYYVDILYLDPNEPGASNQTMTIGDWFIDYTGYPFLINDIIGSTIKVYDINERGNGITSSYGPYANRVGFIYRPKNGAFLLTQAQLRKLDASAADVIQCIEKGVLWKYLTHVDQTIPQTIVNGRPIFKEGIVVDPLPADVAHQKGAMYYDKKWDTLAVDINNDVTVQLAQEEHQYVYNNSGVDIFDGQAVYVTGVYTNGIGPTASTVALARADKESTSNVIGCATTHIANGSYGHITIRGNINNFDTTSFGTVGNTLYLSTTNAGALTTVKPTPPNIIVRIGILTVKNATTGSITVSRVSWGDMLSVTNLKATQNPGISAETPINAENISINTTTRVLTITPPLGYFHYFTDGGGIVIKREVLGSISFPAFDDVSGIWYFYFDSNGSAITTQTSWDNFNTIAPVYRVLWNKDIFNFTVTSATATTNDTYTNNGSTFTVRKSILNGTVLVCERTAGTNNPAANGNLVRTVGSGTNPIVFSSWDSSEKLVAQYIEYHINDIPAAVHLALHLDGARWSNGFNIFNNALSTGTPNADGRNTVIALSSGTNLDDNLPYTITNSTSQALWNQDLGNTTPASLNATNAGLFEIFVQNASSEVYFLPATRFPFAWDEASNRPQIINSVGTRIVVTDNRWFVYFIYATQNPKPTEALKLIGATTEFSSLADARACTWSTLQSIYPVNGSDNEIRPLYRIIFYNDNDKAGSFPAGCKYSVIREVQDLRNGEVTSVALATGSIAATSVTYIPTLPIAGTNVQSALDNIATQISYTNATPMPTQVGGYEVATTFTSQTIKQMFDGLLYPYQYPAFLTFAISGQTTPLEVGASILANRTFIWTTSSPSNINTNSLAIRDVTGATNIATGLADDGTEATTYAAIVKNTATTNQFSITGTNSKSTTFTKTYTVAWQWKIYYGESVTTPLAESGIEGLRIGVLASGFAGTYIFNALTNGYKYLCYPAVLGTATSFKDTATQLPVPMETVYTVSVTNVNGVSTNYNVHRSTNILNGAVTIIVA